MISKLFRAFGRPNAALFFTFVAILAWPMAGHSATLPTEVPRLVATRWSDNSRFSGQTWYRQTGELYQPYFSSVLKFHGSDFCNDLLEYHQLFPLNRMVNDVYISPAQRDLLIKLGSRLDIRQFRFYELISEMTPEELANPKLDAKQGDIYLPLLAMNKVLKPDATLWSVRAQITTPEKRFVPTKMPWQLDPEFEDVEFNREKFKYAIEIGRAVNNVNLHKRGRDTLVSAAILGLVNDIMAYGGNLKDGYVMVHALGRGQATLFKLPKIPGTTERIFKVYAQDKKNEHNQVLIAHLPDLLKYLPPDQFSKVIRDVVERSSGRLDWFGAVEHLFTIQDHMRQDLELLSPISADREHPIIMRNTTPIVGWFMALVSQRYGLLNEKGKAIADFLSTQPWLDHDLRGDFIIDTRVVATEEISKYKLISISNLDPKKAAKDPQYGIFTLMAAYTYYAKLLQQTYPDRRAEILHQTNFVVNSSDPLIQAQLSRFTPHSIPFPDVDQWIQFKTGGQDQYFSLNAEIGVQPGFVFPSAAVERLLQQRPDLARMAQGAMQKGNAQILYHLSRPIGF